jgi:hypothetical protein
MPITMPRYKVQRCQLLRGVSDEELTRIMFGEFLKRVVHITRTRVKITATMKATRLWEIMHGHKEISARELRFICDVTGMPYEHILPAAAGETHCPDASYKQGKLHLVF